MRNKPEFRAIREMVGMTQAALADELGVEVRSVKRWESPTAAQQPPQDAWDVLDAALERQREVVGFALDKVHDVMDETGGAPQAVVLPYWANADEYAVASTDAAMGVAGDWRMANANERALAAILWSEGIDVAWSNGNPARP